MIGAILVLHGIGSCWLFLTFVDDVKAELIALNEYKKLQEIRTKIPDHLLKFIKFQSKIKQLSIFQSHNFFSSQNFFYQFSFHCIFRMLTKLCATYSLLFTSDLLWTLATMAVSLVSIQIELVEYCVIITTFNIILMVIQQ